MNQPMFVWLARLARCRRIDCGLQNKVSSLNSTNERGSVGTTFKMHAYGGDPPIVVSLVNCGRLSWKQDVVVRKLGLCASWRTWLCHLKRFCKSVVRIACDVIASICFSTLQCFSTTTLTMMGLNALVTNPSSPITSGVDTLYPKPVSANEVVQAPAKQPK